MFQFNFKFMFRGTCYWYTGSTPLDQWLQGLCLDQSSLNESEFRNFLRLQQCSENISYEDASAVAMLQHRDITCEAFRDVSVFGDTDLEQPSFRSNKFVVEIHVDNSY
ncbi:Uncharacterized protein Rs2_19120 [Raphanus sativus]|nr:Uncharacterized protein Rs2_19120 [Raphanus sativus]